jgi:hypothetical protein
MFYAYVYRDPTRQNEAIYVGKGKGRRAYTHLTRKDRHPLTARLKAMGDVKPSIEIVQALDEGHAYFLEKCLIDIIGRKDKGTGTLLNLSDGGEGLTGPSQELCEMRRVRRLGQRWSDESKKRMSQSARKTRQDPAVRARMSLAQQTSEARKAYNATMNKPCTVDGIKIFPSRKALMAELGANKNGSGHPGFRYV